MMSHGLCVAPVRLLPSPACRRHATFPAWPGLRSRISHACRPVCSTHSRSSFGSSSDEENELARELAPLIDPERVQRAANALELAWDISMQPRPQECVCCNGAGVKECGWCNGTGFMTVGDKLVKKGESSAGCKECPVCDGQGSCRCSACKGTGKRATWMKQPNCSLP